MIGIIDYGMGNVNSIVNMFKKLGFPSQIVSDPLELSKFNRIILPGVGSFDHGITYLKEKGFFDKIKEFVIKKDNILLGICLGMQMLGLSSEEGSQEGLGLINFINKKFDFASNNSNFKIPHMGWNYVKMHSNQLGEFLNPQKYYFVHSYHAVVQDSNNVLFMTNYGYDFPSAVIRENIIGFQFHPEKSHLYGMELLKRFMEYRYVS